MNFSRRRFLTLAGASAAGVTVLSPLEAFYARVAQGKAVVGTGFGKLKPLLPVNNAELSNTIYGDLSQEALLALPPGFKYRAISITGQKMNDGSLVPAGHDGMAAFPGPRNTTILVRNHELGTSSPYPVVGAKKYSTAAQGGTTTIILGRDRQVMKHFSSLAGTIRNCAGGPTPWGSWISCEETFSTTSSMTNSGTMVVKKHGYNFEVIAGTNTGLVAPIPLVDMGRFSHEAVAVDPATGYIYETEDRGDSCFYRFVPNVKPNQPGDLALGGTLYALKIKEQFAANTTNNPNYGGQIGGIPVGKPLAVEWVAITNPDPTEEDKTKGVGVRYEAQSKGAAIFYRGEGAWYHNGLIYFIATQGGSPAFDSKTGNGQVWIYNTVKEELTLYIEADPNGQLLDEPDNITVSPFGDLFLCEDGGGEQYVVGVNTQGELYHFAKNVIFANSSNSQLKEQFADNEFAGACFSPDGKTLFVNIQTPGITLAIWGPWWKSSFGV
ncbi:alkaline phosphatase PhoX [Calothrix sp. 336/3]|uniref:alkaline phosphatase PhoX n=1 Tax=Calothrix sp. 336/3 TaxID=1337936 RepID=UPI0004E45BB5|nr:alkaline phosphatase PhoX [Calothrix sp. 336/3]AKG20825.1 phosphatase [Calothrix sp. 336/3]